MDLEGFYKHVYDWGYQIWQQRKQTALGNLASPEAAGSTKSMVGKLDEVKKPTQLSEGNDSLQRDGLSNLSGAVEPKPSRETAPKDGMVNDARGQLLKTKQQYESILEKGQVKDEKKRQAM